MKPSSYWVRVVGIAALTGILLSLVVAWLWWIALYDRKWQRPSDLIEGFLASVQNRDHAKARTFFSSHQLTNIAAWEGSFEHWCDQIAAYKSFEVSRTGLGKSGYYWMDVSGTSPDGHRQFVERIYAKRSDGVWSLEYGLSYESWFSLNKGGDPARDENSH